MISVYGVLNEENLMKEPEGVLVNLKACLIYKQDETKRAITEMAVKIYPPLDDNDEKTVLLVTEELRKTGGVFQAEVRIQDSDTDRW